MDRPGNRRDTENSRNEGGYAAIAVVSGTERTSPPLVLGTRKGGTSDDERGTFCAPGAVVVGVVVVGAEGEVVVFVVVKWVVAISGGEA